MALILIISAMLRLFSRICKNSLSPIVRVLIYMYIKLSLLLVYAKINPIQTNFKTIYSSFRFIAFTA